MTNSLSPQKSKNFWDIVVIRDDGQWVGFRAPWISLRRVSSFLAFVLILCGISTLGWVLSRWKVRELGREVVQARRESDSLRSDLERLRQMGLHPTQGSRDLDRLSVLPGLGSDSIASSYVSIEGVSIGYDTAADEIAVKFTLKAHPQSKDKDDFYWVALVHGPQGVMTLPAAFSQRGGDSVLFEKGNRLEGVSGDKAVLGRYKVNRFVELAGASPVYVTLVVYDFRGTLLVRQRYELHKGAEDKTEDGRG